MVEGLSGIRLMNNNGRGFARYSASEALLKFISENCSKLFPVFPQGLLPPPTYTFIGMACVTGSITTFIETTEEVIERNDEDMLVELNKQRLKRLGYDVVATTSSMDALDIFRKKPDTFDLVVTDYTMPNLTGMDLAAECLKVKPTIPIILLHGSAPRPSHGNRLKTQGSRHSL